MKNECRLRCVRWREITGVAKRILITKNIIIITSRNKFQASSAIIKRELGEFLQQHIPFIEHISSA